MLWCLQLCSEHLYSDDSATASLIKKKVINMVNTVTLSVCFGQSGILVAWRIYLVIFFYSTVLFKVLKVLEKILAGIGVPRHPMSALC